MKVTTRRRLLERMMPEQKGSSLKVVGSTGCNRSVENVLDGNV
jgi:hypothetical protein